MATSFDSVYQRFMSKVSDYEWDTYTEEELRDELVDYVYTAISEFVYCRQDLNDISVDMDGGLQFSADLTNDELELLTGYMVLRWYDTKFINKQTLLKQTLPSKDFNVYSPANQLAALRTQRDAAMKNTERLRTIYTYKAFNIKDYLRSG